MKAHLSLLFFCLCIVTSCVTSPDRSKEIHLSKGDIVRLERSFTIPDLYSHVIFQDGEIVKENSLQHYKTSCFVDTFSLGPKTIQQNNYRVSKVSYSEDWYSSTSATLRYYTEFHLDAADPDENIILTCQVLDGPMQHHGFPLSEIRKATGQYFTFSSTDNK
jgi:hypothetical protein